MTNNPVPGLQRGELPMVGVTLVDDLLQSPPSFFTIDNSFGEPTFDFDHTQVNVCVSSSKRSRWFPDSRGRVLTVQTISEYEQLSHDLLEKPLFLDVSLERFTAPAFENYKKTTKAEMFVTVNTSHSVIRGQLLRILEEGRSHLAKGENFALEIDFNGVIRDWFRSLFVHEEGLLSCLNTLVDCEHGAIVITNSTEFMDCCGCSSIYSAMLFLCCLPCCVLTCPCYRVHRCLTTKDHKTHVQGEVMYLSWKPSEQGNREGVATPGFMVLREVEASTRVRGVYEGRAVM